jgi:hypothetical protein
MATTNGATAEARRAWRPTLSRMPAGYTLPGV